MKIGFVSNLYYTYKGHSYVTELLLKTVLEDGHEAHMYRIRGGRTSDEFVHPTSLRTCKDLIIPKKDFVAWLDEVQPEVCVFNEYAQWWDEDHDKLDICRERGIKTIGYLVQERLVEDKNEHYKKYTHIISPTKYQQKMFIKKSIYNSIYIPWGDYNDVYENVANVKFGDKITFLHIAGSGGADNRKNTEKVIEAFKQVQDDTVDLKITHLQSKPLTRKEILGFTKAADVIINTSKWETIGLNTIEANKLGVPVIVADAPPMNELVQNRVNGLTVECETKKSDIVSCPVNDVEVDELAKAIQICKNDVVLTMLKKNAKTYADKYFDWDKNKAFFLELLVT